MTRRMRTSKSGLALVKGFEGFRARAIRLPAGGWTVGYGHTQSARKNLRITPADAEAVLREYDLPPLEKLISTDVLAPLNQNEFDALISFVFNIGPTAFAGSDVLAYLNAGERLAAAGAMMAWRKANLNGRIMVVDALVRRRAAEQALFLRHPGGPPIAPSGFIRPIEDDDLRPRQLAGPKVPLALAPPAVPGPVPEPAPDKTPDRAVAEPRTDDTRLTRVLGASNDDEIFSAGPTPDEITRAISALANPDGVPDEFPEDHEGEPADTAKNTEPVAPLKETWSRVDHDDHDDLPPLSEMDLGADKPDTPEPSKVAIDDLEPVEIDPHTLREAIENGDVDAALVPVIGSPGSLFRGFLALFGLGLGGFGVAKLNGWLEVVLAEDAVTDQYYATASAVFGGCLLLLALFLMLRLRRTV